MQGKEIFACSLRSIHTQGRGEVRLIHAKEPAPAFGEDFDKCSVLYDSLEMQSAIWKTLLVGMVYYIMRKTLSFTS